MAPALVLGCTLILFACGNLEGERLSSACPPGMGHGIWDLFVDEEQSSGEVRRLLEKPNFGAFPDAAGDLRAGIVDERVVAVLRTISEEHSVCVNVFKEGHQFIPGVPDGPRIPEGYGEAGGLPN